MVKKITKVWEDDDYKVFKNKWRNKGEYKIVKEIRERFDEMKEGRRTSCPWATYIEEPATSSDSAYAKDYESIKSVSTGTNWADRWNLDYMLWSMYHTYNSERSNLKSPISFAPIEAAMAEFQEGNVTVSMSPTEEDDFKKTRIYEHMFRHWEVTNNINAYKATSFHEDMITGSSWDYAGWISSYRDVDIILTGKDVKGEVEKMNLSPELEDKILNSKKGEEMTTDELKELIGKEKEDQQQAVYNIAKQKPITKHVKNFRDYDDAVFIPESIFDIYVDNSARYMNAPAYEATDLVKREIITLDQFKIRFKNAKDPWVIKENINKVVSAKDASDLYQTQDSRFFEIPEDIDSTDEDKLEVLHYYNKSTDKYIIIVNDVLARKGPLPFNHKQIPFSFHKFIEWPNMFYGVGMPVILECLQSEDETLRNMMLDQLKLTINPPVFINTDVFQDIDIGWEEVTPGLKVEVGGPVGPESIRWFEGTNPKMDYFRIRDGLKSDAIEATGINPIAYSIPKPNEAVRTHIMSMESTMKILKKGIKNWSEGYKEAAKQIIKNMEQKYPLSYVEEIDGQGNVQTKYKTIRTKGIRINANDLEEEQIGKNEYGYLELKDTYLNTKGEIDVEINTDTLLPMTKGLQVENIKEALQTLPQVMANPDVMNIPGISDLIKKYVGLLGVGESITEQLQDTSSEEEVINAQKQNESMANEEYLEGIPGESYAHKDQHRMLLMDSYKLLSQMKPDKTTIAQETKLRTVIDILEKHVMSDDTPKSEGVKSALGRGQSLKQPPMQAQGGMPPQGGMPTEAMMGGPMPTNQQMGMPAPGGMPGAPAGVPMPPQGM